MNRQLSIALRAVVGLVVLGVLAWTVTGWWRDYKTAPKTTPAEATSTASPAGGEGEQPTANEGSAKPDLVIVRIDGLNLREKPASDSDSIRGLNKGERLTLLKKQSGWYQVKSSKGETGWVSSNSNYSRVETR